MSYLESANGTLTPPLYHYPRMCVVMSTDHNQAAFFPSLKATADAKNIAELLYTVTTKEIVKFLKQYLLHPKDLLVTTEVFWLAHCFRRAFVSLWSYSPDTLSTDWNESLDNGLAMRNKGAHMISGVTRKISGPLYKVPESCQFRIIISRRQTLRWISVLKFLSEDTLFIELFQFVINTLILIN